MRRVGGRAGRPGDDLPSTGGVDPDLAWRSLRLIESDVVPHLISGHDHVVAGGANLSSDISSPRRLRALLEVDGPILLPGAYDVVSARIIEDEGLAGMCLGGFAAGASSLVFPIIP